MNLKEAFRFQNKLQSLMDETQGILSKDINITEMKTISFRSKVMADAADETVVLTPETEYYEEITKITQFLLYLLAEREKLTASIRKAKNVLEMDMDGEISLNAVRQSVAKTLRHMNDLRNSEQHITNGGTGYCFNAEGNQVRYCCDAKRVTTINYDRNVIKSMLKALNSKTDETSTQLDMCLVTSSVDYYPPFEVNASFADAFETYKEASKKE